MVMLAFSVPILLWVDLSSCWDGAVLTCSLCRQVFYSTRRTISCFLSWDAKYSGRPADSQGSNAAVDRARHAVVK
jgi:hypothetical protein